MGAFSYFIDDENFQDEYGDSGHLEQSITTTQFFLKNIHSFWGSGFRNEIFYVDGQSVAIHNSYVNNWAIYGLHMTFYLIYTLILLLIKFNDERKNIKSNPFFIKFGIIVYLVIFYIVGWFNGQDFFHVIQYFTKFVLLFSIIKVNRTILSPNEN